MAAGARYLRGVDRVLPKSNICSIRGATETTSQEKADQAISIDRDRQACSPLIQLFFEFASDINQTNINRDMRDGNWLSSVLFLCLKPILQTAIF